MAAATVPERSNGVFGARLKALRDGRDLSLRDLAERCGLSKRAVQTAVGALARRRLVAVARDGPTAVPVYAVLRPWERRGK